MKATSLAGALILVPALLSAMGCAKKKQQAGDDLGDQASWERVLKELEAAEKGNEITQTKKDEAALFHNVLYLAGGSGQVTASVLRRTLDRQDTDDLVRLDLLLDGEEYGSDGITEAVLRHLVLIFDPRPSSGDGAASPPPRDLQFYNLRVERGRTPPPAEVRKQPDCRQTPNCEIQFTRINFDQVLRDGSRFRRVNFEALFSPTVPKIANPVTVCQKATMMLTVDDTGRRAPIGIRACTELIDYQYLKPTADLNPRAYPLDSSASAVWRQFLSESETFPQLRAVRDLAEHLSIR